jgi:16S rRNA (guanine966-N2)-methyltransferase
MRIVAGRWGGRSLVAPRGMDTRPTLDAHRETLFNILIHGGHLDFIENREGKIAILDLFAGTGALTLELCSRLGNLDNSVEIAFFESSKEAISCIQKNVTNLDAELNGISIQYCNDPKVETWDKKLRSFKDLGIIFCDPPYGKGFLPKVLKMLERCFEDFLKDMKTKPILVLECEKELKIADQLRAFSKWRVLKSKVMGVSQFLILKRQ